MLKFYFVSKCYIGKKVKAKVIVVEYKRNLCVYRWYYFVSRFCVVVVKFSNYKLNESITERKKIKINKKDMDKFIKSINEFFCGINAYDFCLFNLYKLNKQSKALTKNIGYIEDKILDKKGDILDFAAEYRYLKKKEGYDVAASFDKFLNYDYKMKKKQKKLEFYKKKLKKAKKKKEFKKIRLQFDELWIIKRKFSILWKLFIEGSMVFDYLYANYNCYDNLNINSDMLFDLRLLMGVNNKYIIYKKLKKIWKKRGYPLFIVNNKFNCKGLTKIEKKLLCCSWQKIIDKNFMQKYTYILFLKFLSEIIINKKLWE